MGASSLHGASALGVPASSRTCLLCFLAGPGPLKKCSARHL